MGTYCLTGSEFHFGKMEDVGAGAWDGAQPYERNSIPLNCVVKTG